MQQSVTIRLVEPADLVAFRELRLEALQSAPMAFGDTYALAVERPTAFWQSRIQDGMGGPIGATYLAETDQGLVGMAGIFRNLNPVTLHLATIWGVYLRESARGQQIADRMIQACLDWAISMQIRIVRLSVVAENSTAIRLYTRLGFQPYGVEAEALYRNGLYIDELLMARRLV